MGGSLRKKNYQNSVFKTNEANMHSEFDNPKNCKENNLVMINHLPRK
jgi:hypothetical protein